MEKATDRRVLRTKRSLREAFLSLVLEHGFESVGVDDIAERADVARATFYAHYATKHEMLEALFDEIITELVDHIAGIDHDDLGVVRVGVVTGLYVRAEELRDLYLVVLRGAGDGRARLAYLETVADGARRIFARRLERSGATPKVPLDVIARAWAGTHVALLHAWLEDPDRPPAEEAAREQILLLAYGVPWALEMGEFRLDIDET